MKRIIDRYNKAEEYLLVGSLVLTVALVFIQVVMRYVFNNSLSWSEELTRFIFIWQIWLGVSVGLREKKHIRVELLQSFLKPRVLLVMDILASTIWMASCVYLTYSGFDLVERLMQRNSLSTALLIPLWTVYAALPVSSAIVVIRQIIHLREDFYRLINYGRGA